MSSLAERVHKAVEAVCPIVSIRIGRPSDKATWQIHFSTEASAAQQQAGLAALAAFDAMAPEVPWSVKMWQAKAALAASGKLEAANAAVASANSPALAIAWEYAADVSRDSAGLNGVAIALGMTEADVDALFIAAAAIKI